MHISVRPRKKQRLASFIISNNLCFTTDSVSSISYTWQPRYRIPRKNSRISLKRLSRGLSAAVFQTCFHHIPKRVLNVFLGYHAGPQRNYNLNPDVRPTQHRLPYLAFVFSGVIPFKGCRTQA